MELQQLRHFVAVVENKTMHAASRALRLSQPALTRSIQDLERTLGVILFDRRSRRVFPTAAGIAFLRHACVILDDCGRAKDEAVRTDSGRSDDVALGIGPSIQIDAAINAISARFPDMRLRVAEGHFEELIEQLRAGSLDLFCGTMPMVKITPEVVHEPISKVRGSVFVHADNPLARKRKLSLNDLANEFWLVIDQPHTKFHLESAFIDSKIMPPSRLLHTNSLPLIKSLMLKGGFLTCIHDDFFAAEAKQGLLKRLDVRVLNYEREVGLFYRDGAYRKPAAMQVAEIIREKFRPRNS